MRDITLCDDLSEDEVFVKGSFNQGRHKKIKDKRSRPRRRNFQPKQNMNRDNNSNHKYVTRSNNRHHETNPPSTSTNQHVTSNASSSSTGACKKVLNKKNPQHFFNSNTSESEDENLKNLPNIQYSKQKDCNTSSESVPKNTNNSLLNSEKSKCEANNSSDAVKCVSPRDEKKDSEVAGALSNCEERTCGICFEVVMEKVSYQRKFGILPNCNHCFCLTCIRKWRQAKQFENNIIRACPECRVTSDFVCPSSYWADTVSEKETLITNYKKALSTKDCKYFRKGNGSCPFGNKCFYLHALNDGTKVDVGPPPSQRYENDEINDIEEMIFLEYIAYRNATDSDSDSNDDDDDLLEIMFWSSIDDIYF
ncbi:putative zinc ion binding protein [Trypoxylus dichotomus]